MKTHTLAIILFLLSTATAYAQGNHGHPPSSGEQDVTVRTAVDTTSSSVADSSATSSSGATSGSTSGSASISGAYNAGSSSSVTGGTSHYQNTTTTYNPVAYNSSIQQISCAQDSLSVSGRQGLDEGGHNSGSGIHLTYTHLLGGSSCKEAQEKQLRVMDRAALYQKTLDTYNVAFMAQKLKASILHNEVMRVEACRSLHHNTTVEKGGYFNTYCKGIEFLHFPSPDHASEHARIAPHVTVE